MKGNRLAVARHITSPATSCNAFGITFTAKLFSSRGGLDLYLKNYNSRGRLDLYTRKLQFNRPRILAKLGHVRQRVNQAREHDVVIEANSH